MNNSLLAGLWSEFSYIAKSEQTDMEAKIMSAASLRVVAVYNGPETQGSDCPTVMPHDTSVGQGSSQVVAEHSQSARCCGIDAELKAFASRLAQCPAEVTHLHLPVNAIGIYTL